MSEIDPASGEPGTGVPLAPELALLAVAAGCVDVLAFAGLGGVLPSAMTGNTALLGLAVGRGRLGDAALALLAFGGFVLGAAAASVARDLIGEHLPEPLAGVALLLPEALLLIVFAIGWAIAAHPIGGPWRDAMIVIAAIGMGIQGVVARSDAGPSVSTIVFTSTLTAIVAALARTLTKKPHRVTPATRRQIVALVAYFIGAVLGALAFLRGLGALSGLPAAAVLSALAHHLWSHLRATAGPPDTSP
ncbi:MAG: YoaK family protein [Acetobacteraceae bacterium]